MHKTIAQQELTNQEFSTIKLLKMLEIGQENHTMVKIGALHGMNMQKTCKIMNVAFSSPVRKRPFHM